MFTERVKQYLEKLTYNASAEREVSILPLGGIYWKDEIPDWDRLFELSEADKNAILRLFAIRFQLWAGEELSADDAAYWSGARSLFPGCPIFHRLKLSAEEEQAQEVATGECLEFFDAMFSGATDVTVTEDSGITRISGTHKLKNEDE